MEWVTDQSHRPRVTLRFEGKEYKITASDPNGKNWKTLWEFEAFAEDQVWPMGFGLDPNILYVRAYHQGRNAVFRVDLTDPEL